MSLRYQWKLRQNNNAEQEAQLVQQTGLPLLLVKLLLNRGFTTATQINEFLAPSEQQIHDPFLMHDMAVAVERISNAIMESEKILIYGDYDADGITSTAILKEAIAVLGGQADIFVPNRFTDGYGPNLARYKEFVDQDYKLIVTVDNGITGFDEITYAKEHGVDVIVTDHHTIPSQLPPAVAIVHPQFEQENPYPCPYLSGAGVAFKLASALLEELPVDLLDLAAIGTVSDVMKLVGENRALVALGLQQIRSQERLGLVELSKTARLKMSEVSEDDIGFQIAPRLNALGRLDDATLGVTLLTTLDEEEAKNLAKQVDQLNQKRKDISQTVYESAWKQAEEQLSAGNQFIVVAGEDWQQGILGIVAGKILQRSGCPTLVFSVDEAGIAVGSGRSNNNFDLYAAMVDFQDKYQKFGGHQQACGLTMDAAQVDDLRTELNNLAVTQQLDINQQSQQEFELDLPVKELNLNLYAQLQRLAPFGNGNPIPVVRINAFDNCTIDYLSKKSNDHLKIILEQQGYKLDGLGFGWGENLEVLQQSGIKYLYGTLMTNNWRNQSFLQLNISDIQLDADFSHIVGNLQFVDMRQQTKLSLPTDSSKLFFFQSNNQTNFLANNPQYQTMLATPDSEAIVLVDRPLKIKHFDDFVQKFSKLEKLSFIFYDHKPFEAIADEKWHETLKYLITHQNLRAKDLPTVAKYLNLSNLQIKVIFIVFSELKFVTIIDGFLKWADKLPAASLTESPTYCRLQEHQQVEQLLIKSDFADLTKYVSQLMR